MLWKRFFLYDSIHIFIFFVDKATVFSFIVDLNKSKWRTFFKKLVQPKL